ncbi:hypothetical protein [Flavobacterium poyangense]|uniref:hypothetical protein n=1 Tax=Flavobacterium poyangense TaxID=2204302 RepID=UPI00141E3CC4|nr:hypothetical protein [Flavobacterium sp. JXAS1]
MKTILYLTILIVTAGSIKAQNFKNEFHVGYSDGFTLSMFDMIGSKLPSSLLLGGITGEKVKSTSESSFGLIEAGYKYQITKKIKLGLTIAYQRYSAKLITEKTSEFIKQESNYTLFLPNFNYSYIKTPLLDFYGSASAGVLLSIDKYTHYKKSAPTNQVDFAWQISPLGLRVGKRIGGFVEAGFGLKGFVTVGANCTF